MVSIYVPRGTNEGIVLLGVMYVVLKRLFGVSFDLADGGGMILFIFFGAEFQGVDADVSYHFIEIIILELSGHFFFL